MNNIRKAKMSEVVKIQGLIEHYSQIGEMLPRSLYEIYEFLRDFWVYEENGIIKGTVALHFSWENLAEIRSLAVGKEFVKKNIGKKLIETALEDANNYGIKRVFVLTYKPKYFQKFGFNEIDKNILPHKIWADCLKCPLFPDCNEIAMAKDCE